MPSVLFAVALVSSVPPPMGFELQAPKGERWGRRAAQTAEIAQRTLSIRARLRLASMTQIGVPAARASACRAQPSLDCWVRAQLDANPGPFDAPSVRTNTDFLFVRLLPVPRRDRALVLMWLVNLDTAAQGIQSVPPGQAEGWLLRNATVRRRLEVTWRDGALETAFERLWDARQATFKRRGVWWPNGSLRIETPWLPPYRVVIDGEPVRTATAATTFVPRIAVGVHDVRVRTEDGSMSRRVRVQMGRQSSLLFERRTPSGDDERPALLWSGVGVATAGAAIVVAGLAMPVTSKVVRVCPANDPGCDPTAGFARSSDYFSARSIPSDGSGPLVVPLGYSLMVTGAAWSLTALLLDDPDVPWWTVVVGLALGGLSYGLTEAVQ